MQTCFILIFTYFFFTSSATAACSGEESTSQSVSNALYNFGVSNNISEQSIYELQAKVLKNCGQKQSVFSKIFDGLPSNLRRQLTKEKNIKKLKDRIVAAIDKVEIKVDGKTYKILLTDNGNLAMLGMNEGTDLLSQLGSSVKNFLKKDADELIFSGFIGQRDRALNKESQRFEWKINGKTLNDFKFNGKFFEKALGYVKIKGLGVSSGKIITSFESKADWLSEDAYVKLNVKKCGESFCLDGGGKVDYDFDGNLVVSSHIDFCSGNSKAEVCIGGFQKGDEVGIKSSLDLSLGGGKEINAKASVSNFVEQANIRYTSGAGVGAYAVTTKVKSNESDDDGSNDRTTSEIGAAVDLGSNKQFSIGTVESEGSRNTFVKFGVTW